MPIQCVMVFSLTDRGEEIDSDLPRVFVQGESQSVYFCYKRASNHQRVESPALIIMPQYLSASYQPQTSGLSWP